MMKLHHYMGIFENVCVIAKNSQPLYDVSLHVRVPRMKIEFGQKSFCEFAANDYSNVSILARQLNPSVLFRAHLDDLHGCI